VRRWPPTSPPCTPPTWPRPTRSRPRCAARCRCWGAAGSRWPRWRAQPAPAGHAGGTGPLRGRRWSCPARCPGWSGRCAFYDPVVVPALGLIDERDAPAYGEVRHALGITTTTYHVVAQPGSGLTPHHAGHVGAGLASGHSAAARDFETIRSRVRGREHLVDELIGRGRGRAAARAGAAGPGDRPAQPRGRRSHRHPPARPDRRAQGLADAVGGRREWRRNRRRDPPGPHVPGLRERHSRAIGSPDVPFARLHRAAAHPAHRWGSA
jgi:hypothetical protein